MLALCSRLFGLPRGARYVLCGALLALHAWLLLGARVTPWHDGIVFPAVLLLTARLVEPPPKRRFLVLAALAAIVLSFDLLYVWRVGYAGRNHVFGGIFSLSDAGEYYADAERVLHGLRMNSGGARRPIFSAVLGGVLRLVGNDIRAAHVVTLLFWAASLAFATSEIWRTHGRRAALTVFVILVLFARRYVGFVHSEGIGGPAGALAFGLLWRAQSMKADWKPTYRGALALQTLALLARPGPMFVIAGVVIWGVRRAEKGTRRRLFIESAACVAAAILVQHVVRSTSTSFASFTDLPPILYGMIHAEDSHYVWQHNPWLTAIDESARPGAIWRLIGEDLLAHPWLAVVAPLRCVASWFYLPQGFFGCVWLNPDERLLENVSAGKRAGAELGAVGLALQWIHELGVYSLGNAVVMAIAAFAFALAPLRSIGRALRAWRSSAPPTLTPVLLGLFVSLPLLPPWITEGAQILAPVFVYVATFAVTAFLPASTAIDDDRPPRPAPALGPATVLTLSFLAVLPCVSPRRPPREACSEDGGFLGDVDRRAAVVYGTDETRPTLTDSRGNLALLERSNAPFARSLLPTLGRPHEMLPVFDACAGRLVYLVHPLDTPGDSIAKGEPWITLHTSPMTPRRVPALEHTSTTSR